MGKKLQIIYADAFLAICVTPLALLPIVGIEEDTSENRQLSEMPSFVENGKINSDWGNQFETYFSEHFALRGKLVTLDSMIKSATFKTSSNEKVIVGKNDWLYFADTLPDYTGSERMTQRRVYNTAKTLQLLQEHFENDGKSFLFMCAPNKNSVYSENMPSRIIKSDKPTNLDRLSDILNELSVNNISIKDIFSQYDQTLYLQRDSHWTNEGAAIAFNAAADALGWEHYDYTEYPHSIEKVWHADLDGMLFPSYERLSEQVVYDHESRFEYAGSFLNEDDLLIKTSCQDGSGNLLMYRDSFGRAFYPIAAESAQRAYFSRELPYKTSLADEVKADYVILEVVERNLSYITQRAPFMNAPEREIDISADVVEGDNSCTYNIKGKHLNISGILDEEYFASNSDILITMENEDGLYCFEPFPIYESGDDEQTDTDYGFSLTVNKNELDKGIYEIYAYVENNGEYICTQALAEVEI